jgi:hypothetical protein
MTDPPVALDAREPPDREGGSLSMSVSCRREAPVGTGRV